MNRNHPQPRRAVLAFAPVALLLWAALALSAPAGATWISQTSGTPNGLRDVHFPVDVLTGYVVGNSGTILKTTDGGASWVAQTSGTTENLRGVHFPVDADTGYAVGALGTILKTTDGGATPWVAQTSPTANNLWGVHFPVDADTGYAVGALGTILKTMDGGATPWVAQTSPNTEDLHGLHLVDENIGYAVGDLGTILKTTDGGATPWVAQTSPTANNLWKVHFPVDANIGYAVGVSGTILKTTDGGVTPWVAQTSGTTELLTALHFPVDSTTGYVVGNSATILFTTDGGVTPWVAQTSPTAENLRGVHFPVDAANGYAVGGNGTILATAPYVESNATWQPGVEINNWFTKDLSGPPFNVPANAVVEIAVRNSDTALPSGGAHLGGVRAVGSSLSRSIQLHQADGGGFTHVTMHVQANGASEIQFFAETADVDFLVLGYWDGGVAYDEEFAPITPAGSGWQTQALSGVAAGEVAEVAMTNRSNDTSDDLNNAGRWAGARKTGSALDRRVLLDNAATWVFVLKSGDGENAATLFVEADGSSEVELYADNTVDPDITFYVLGSFTAPPGTFVELAETDWTNSPWNTGVGSPTAAGAYPLWEAKDMSAWVPSGAVAEILVGHSADADQPQMGVRSTGSSIDRSTQPHDAGLGGAIPAPPCCDEDGQFARMHVVVDGTGSIEWTSNTVADTDDHFLLSGYWVREVQAFTVNSTGDTGDNDIGNGVCYTGFDNSQSNPECTLRAAIEEANFAANTDAIHFNIPTTESGYSATPLAWTIAPQAPYDDIQATVDIDATTQPGFAGDPVIQLDGTDATGATAALTLEANDSLIEGFIVHTWDDEGLEIDASTGAGDDNILRNNWVGIDAGENLKTIGDAGILLTVGAGGNLVEGNVVGGSTNSGVVLRNLGTDNNIIIGNSVGVGPNGSSQIPNGLHGIELYDQVTGNRIGGIGAEGNVIANNAGDGVWLAATVGSGNAILGNSIHSNGGLGIDFDPDGVTANGPGDPLDFPVITSVTETGGVVDVDFDLDVPAGAYRIEFFYNSAGDLSGNGEGESPVGFYNVVAHPGGLASYSTSFGGPIGNFITATTTEEISAPFGSTSEFSGAYETNAAPLITLPSGPVNYIEGDPPTVIDGLATVSDPDSTDFNLGILTVDFAANGTANDRLAINDEGPGAGKISLAGINDVTYDFGSGAVIIGSYVGGGDGFTPLVISLVAPADPISTQALLRNITYENVSLMPSTVPRTVRFMLTDGDGGTSIPQGKSIDYRGLNTVLPHEYFVPIPDEQVRSWAVTLDQNTFPPGDDMRAIVSLTLTLDGNRVVYDHWEDGLETNPENAVQATTEIWGDGRAATGCPPTVNRLPLVCTNANDLFDAGDVLALENDVPANPRGTAIRFDGGDLIASDEMLAVTRAGWPVSVGAFSGVVLAGAVEVYVTSEWGSDFEAPVGQDVAGNDMFEYTAFSVMAGADSTLVEIDIEGDGIVDINQTINRGESLLAENVLIGGTVSASKPVQVDLLTGDIDVHYAARWFALQPVERWSNTYYTPVGDTGVGAGVRVFLYNPSVGDITVDYETLATSGNFIVPAGGIYEYTMPLSSGARFFTSGAEPFYALSTIDYDATTYDWGFSLIPADFLSTAAVVGWAPGSSDLTENGSPVWVTAEADTTLYIDYDGDGLSDTSSPLNRLQSLLVRDADNDQTGMRLFTTDGTRIAAAWGQEPGVASTGSPAIDLGTTVLPFINPNLIKRAKLYIDQNGNGLVEPGDTLLYSLTIKNISTAALVAPGLLDTPDANVTYVPGTTEVNGVPIADDAGPATPYPFDESGYTLQTILPGETVVATYQMQVNDPLAPGVFELVNNAEVKAADGSTAAATDEVVSIPDLNITKISDVVGAALPGQIITYTVTVDNASTIPQSDVSVQDALPTGTSYVGQSTVAAGLGTTKDNVPAGANPDLVDGSPPDLVLAKDGFTLNQGESLVVTYQVQVDDPLERGIHRVVNTATASGNNFGGSVSATVINPVLLGGRIGDLVWLDVDGDGVYDIGEPGLANVVVELLDGSCTPGVNCRTTVTGSSGGYLFDRLAPGSYQVLVDESTLPGGAGDLVRAPGTANPSSVVVITAAEQFSGVDFGYTTATTEIVVGDFVWSDADNDGLQDAGEVGIGGVTLDLLDAGTGAVVDTTTTGAGGSYLFTVAFAGEYRVEVTDTGGVLGGYTLSSGPQSSSNPSAPLTVSEGDACLEADFGYYDPSLFSVAETIWLDADADAAVGIDETGLSGVTVLLVEDGNGNGTWDSGEAIVATTTSDGSGDVSFSGLEAGDYLVVVEDADGVLTGMAGTTPAGRSYAVALTTGPDHSARSFGYSRPGTLGDQLWSDADGDGEQDAGEPGLAGVTVELWEDDSDGSFDSTVDTLIGSTTTDAAGEYLFSGLDTWTYFASVDGGQVALSGSTPTTTDEETGGNAAGTQVGGTLGSLDASFLMADFGYQDVSLADISGSVFEDLDADGLDDGVGEPGIAGVSVALIDAGADATFGTDDDLTVAETATDANGDYIFNDVQGSGGTPRTYRVVVTDTAGILVDSILTSGLDEIEITVVGADIADIDFGYQNDSTTASLGDFIWYDTDRDGVTDPGEPGIAGVTVDLYDAGPDGAVGGGDDVLIGSAMTDAGGGYVFGGLVPGMYYVDVTDVGGVLGSLSLTTGSTDPSAVIALSDGEMSVAADFGYGAASGSLLGDSVWHDEDGDGFEDAGEVGIEGVTMRLWDPGADKMLGGGDDTLLGTTTTDASGRYLFTGVPTGKLYAEVDTTTLPSGYTVVPTNGPATRPFEIILNTDNMLADFGFNGATRGSIGDTVYFDSDGDGSQAGANEVGLERVTLDLWRDPDGVPSNGDELLIESTETDRDGTYDFVGLAAGTYYVVVTDTHGVVAELNPTETSPAAITITAAGEDVDGADFGFAPSGGTGAIGDIIWHDVDGDGVYESQGADGIPYTVDDEWGFPHVTVELWLDVNGNGAIDPGTDNLVRTVETDDNGQYELLGVPFGDYVVEVTDTNGVLDINGDGAIHGDEWIQTAPAAPPSEIRAVTLDGANSSDFDADFGYRASDPHTVSGTVFFDANGNGVMDLPENGVSGVRVYLYRDLDGDEEFDPTDARIAATDAGGAFMFVDLPDGDYFLVADTSGSFVDGMTQTTQTATGGIQPVTISGGDETGHDFGFWVQTTAVLVSSFSAEIGGGGVVVRWETASEVGTMGFYLYRWDGEADSYALVNEQLLPASMAAQGGVYELIDDRAQPGSRLRYALVEVEAGGAERTYGPFDVMAERGRAALERTREIRGRSRSAGMSERLMKLSSVGGRGHAVAASAPTSNRPSRSGGEPSHRPGHQRVSTIKLEVGASGLYEVTTGQITAVTGVSPSKVAMALDAGKMRLTSGGEPVAWQRSANGLVFFAEAIDSPYTITNVYWLEFGAGATMTSGQGGSPAAGATTVSRAEERYEENTFAVTVTASVDEDLYYWAYMSAGDPTWGSFATTLPVADPEPGEATLTVRFQSTTSTPASDEHRVQLSLNGFDLGTTVWDGATAHRGVLTVPSEVLESGDNAVAMTAELGPGVPYSMVLIDGIELEYPWLHRAIGDRAVLATESLSTVSVEGFSSPEIAVVDVTDPRSPQWLEGVTVTADGGGYRATFMPAGTERRYALAAMPTIGSPVIESRASSIPRTRVGAEYVVIAPAALETGAQALADYRTAMGLSTMVVDLESVYDEHGHGLPTPEAIRTFLAHAWTNWSTQPRFVALAGDGTFDYQEHQGLGDNLLPPLLVGTPQGMFASDVMLGDVVGDDLVPEIAVGRIPALTNDELVAYVTKLSLNESAGFGGVERLTMLADNADAAGNFPVDSDELLAGVPEAVAAERIYLSELAVGDARTATFGAFAAGTEWVNYLGHGGVDRFADEGLLKATDAPALSIGDRLPVVSSLTCSAGRFEVPGWESLAEALVMAPDGGAAVVWAPSGQSYHFEAMAMNQALFQAIFDGTATTVGEIMLETLEIHQPTPGFEYLPTVYNLIGDPAYRVR